MKTHITKTVSSCFAVLRQIRSVRRSVTKPVLLSLAISLVLSRLDYGNATLAGLPQQSLSRLHSALNAAARLVYAARKYEHVTPLLWDLHWLQIAEHIDFKLSVLCFCCLHDIAPPYLTDDLHCSSTTTAVCVDRHACRTKNTFVNLWRPRISSGGSANLEQSATTRRFLVIFANFQTPPQDGFFLTKFS
jgi:hypothetical protein